MSIYSCCCKPRDDLPRFFCFLPLALSLVFVALMFLWWAAWEIYSAVSSPLFANFATVFILIIGCLRALCAVFGIVAVVLKSPVLMKWMATLVDIFVIIAIVQLIFNWISWGLLLGGVGTRNGRPWEPNGEEIASMVIITLLCILFVICGYFIISLCNSLVRVYEVGGNGWEGHNYKDIEAEGAEGSVA